MLEQHDFDFDKKEIPERNDSDHEAQNQTPNFDKRRRNGGKSFEDRDYNSKLQKEIGMAYRINREIHIHKLFNFYLINKCSFNIIALLFKRIIVLYKEKNQLRLLKADNFHTGELSLENHEASLWTKTDFVKISKHIHENIENFSPTSINIILNGLMQLKTWNIIAVNIYNTCIKWLSSGDNYKFLDSDQLARSFNYITKGFYLQDKYQLYSMKD